MWQENGLFLEYAEIRRRIEQRLNTGVSLFVHIALFLCACFIGAQYYPYRYFTYQPDGTYATVTVGPVEWTGLMGMVMLAWSVVLLLHGVWTYRRSASAMGRRAEAVHAELSERYEADDTELLASPRQAFRVRALLSEDLRMRAGWLVAVTALLAANVGMWLIHVVGGAFDRGHWGAIFGLGVLMLPVVVAFNRLRRMRRNGKLRRILQVRPVVTASPRQRPSFDEELERYSRLSDDGELMDMPDDWVLSGQKAKRG